MNIEGKTMKFLTAVTLSILLATVSICRAASTMVYEPCVDSSHTFCELHKFYETTTGTGGLDPKYRVVPVVYGTAAGTATEGNDPRVVVAHNSSSKIVPTTGQTVNVTPSGLTTTLSVEPAGSLVALTMTFDDGTTDGQTIRLVIYQIVSTFTFSGSNIETTGMTYGPAAGPREGFEFVWFASDSKWRAILHTAN